MDEDTVTAVVIAIAAFSAVMIAIFVVIFGLIILALVGVVFVADTSAPPVLTRSAPPNPAQYTWREVASGLDNPLLVTDAGDGSGRLFAVEQIGLVLVIENGEIKPQPFLDVSLLLSDDVLQGGYSERGLLGLAFHPDYKRNGIFFVSHTDRQGNSVLARYHVSADDPDRADPNSRVELLHVQQPFADHNGGNIVFGPDGYLYFGLGDGGNPLVANHNSQDPAQLLGKMLRLDIDTETYTVPATNPFVDDPRFAPEIWAMGLRNPWRFSFDHATGDLYIGDVGQWTWEEIDFQPANSPGGENYGWSAYEGTHLYLDFGEEPLFGPMTEPILEYHHQEGCSVTGGYVYRGAALPDFQGTYLMGDYCTGFIWTAYRDEAGDWHRDVFEDSGFIITSFGEDEHGEIYVVDYKGAIYRLEAAG